MVNNDDFKPQLEITSSRAAEEQITSSIYK
jgi:hypothetical protein